MDMIQVDHIMRTDPSRARLPHDKKYESGIAFINGDYCPLSEAAVPMLDLGFLQSDVVYDKVTVANGRYFRLADHFERFSASCASFRLRNPCTDEQMTAIFDKLLRLSGFKDAGVFWCVTRGLAKRVSDRNNPDAFDSRFYALVGGYGSIATSEQRSKGLDLLVSEKYIRIPTSAVDPKAKNFHWADMKQSLFEARDHGKDMSVLPDADGYLTEAPGANVFLIKNGALYTPGSGCLEGITRKTVLELATLIGIPAHVEKVHAKQLRDADEAFITSSAGGVMPINSVDGNVLGGIEGPGELTVRLHNLYWEKLWEGWKATPVDYEGLTIQPRAVSSASSGAAG